MVAFLLIFVYFIAALECVYLQVLQVLKHLLSEFEEDHHPIAD